MWQYIDNLNGCINLKFVSEGSWPKPSQFIDGPIVYTPSEVGVCDYVRLISKNNSKIIKFTKNYNVNLFTII